MKNPLTSFATPTNTYRSNRDVLIGLMIPTMMVVLDFTMFGVSLPEIRRSFGIQVDTAAWVITFYTLPFMILMPLYGRLGDGLGRRRLYLMGIVIFLAGVVVSMLAPTLGWLMAGRAIQGFGASGSVPLAMAIISQRFPPAERGKAMGTWASVGPVMGIVGPFVGGLLVDYLGWRFIFGPVLLVGLSALFVVPRKVPPIPAAARRQRDFLRAFDWIGVFLLGAMFSTFLFFASSRLITGVPPLQDWRLFTMGLFFLTGFVLLEKQRINPFIPISIFANRTFTITSICAGIRMVCMVGIGFLNPLYLTDVHHLSAAMIGLMLTANASGMLIMMRKAGQLADRWGSHWLVMGGLSVQVCVMVYFAALPQSAPIWLILVGLLSNGLGGGLSMAALHRAAMDRITSEQMGVAAGLYSMSRFVGTVFGTALVGVVLQYGLNTRSLPIQAYQGTFLFIASVGLVGVALGSRLQD